MDRADLANAKAAFERNQIRAKRRAVSRNAPNRSRQAYKEAQALAAIDEAAVTQRRAALYGAEINLGYRPDCRCELRGPAALHYRNGSGRHASQTIVGENDIGNVKIGNKASFIVDALPNRLFTGEVTQIRPPQTYEDLTTYDVVISAPNPDNRGLRSF